MDPNDSANHTATQTPGDDDICTLEQGAAEADCSVATMRRAIRAGKVRAYRRGRRVLVARCDARALTALHPVKPQVAMSHPYDSTADEGPRNGEGGDAREKEVRGH